MSQQLISINPDLKRLQDERFDVEVCGALLVVRHIPYLNASGDIQTGALVMSLELAGERLLKPADHTAHWVGEQPCNIDGNPITSLVNSKRMTNHGHGLITDFYLSCKPDIINGQNVNGRYPDFYTKVTTYCDTISGPALAKDPNSRERFYTGEVAVKEKSSLKYADTNASRSHISGLSEVWKSQKVAIVGVGGTGSYILDFLAKMDVSQIHLYDGDNFYTHNAFRSPGAPTEEILTKGLPKVEYFASIYGNVNSSIVSHAENISEKNIASLYDMDMVFLCVDSNRVRNFIARKLAEQSVNFIDSGLGLYNNGRSIGGQLRVTMGTNGHYDHLKEAYGEFESQDDDPYRDNIQIAEMNALAASLMVVAWKKMLGYYPDDGARLFHVVYNIGQNNLLGNEG